ncbi:MAG: glycosyltransferase family 39 protein [Planctomycetes bacterium]|nr:glycosyltransferase family 39 protein [Planctomycetota bacterium]
MDPCERQPTGLSRRDLLVAAAIFLLTLALRLIYLFHSPDLAWPHSILYEGDAPIWVRWSHLLGGGTPFEDNLPFRTPGVAWLLHWMYSSDAPYTTLAAPFTSVKIVWCIFSAATPAALYLILARWFSRRTGLIAAALCSVSFGSFALSVSLNNEAPYALLVVALTGVTLAWIGRPTWLLALTLGALHGMALLLRAEHELLLAMFLLYAVVRAWREGRTAWTSKPASENSVSNIRHGGATPQRVAGGTVLVLVTILAVCAPWVIRSHTATHAMNHRRTSHHYGSPDPYVVAKPPWTPAAIAYLESLPAFARMGNFAYLSSIAQRNGMQVVDEADVRAFFDREWGYTPEPLNEWTLISLKGPLDFALANHPDADGGFSRVGLKDSHDADATFSLGRPSHSRLVNHGYAVGWDYIRGDFGHWLGQVREKLARFQEGATLGLFANDWPYPGTHVRHAIDLAAPQRGGAPVWSVAVIVSLLVGAVVACRRRGGVIWLLIVAYKIGITIAFYGYVRQAVSIAPALFALSALGLDAACCVGACKHHTLRRWAAGIACAVLFTVAAYQAWFPPRFTPRVAQPNGRFFNAPQWGPGSFESFDELILEPIRYEPGNSPPK